MFAEISLKGKYMKSLLPVYGDRNKHKRIMLTYPKLDKLPQGWVYTKGATTAPKGYRWANNNKSRFEPGYKHALIKVGEQDEKRTKEQSRFFVI